MSSPGTQHRDEYGVALIIFGNHHPDFFPLLGRVVALASVLEYEARSTASRFLEKKTCNVWKDRFSAVTKQLLKQLGETSDSEELDSIVEFIQETECYANRRAIYAHALIPSASLAPSGEVTASRTKPDTTDLELGPNLEILRSDVKQGSSLVEQWNNSLLAILNRHPLLQPEEEHS